MHLVKALPIYDTQLIGNEASIAISSRLTISCRCSVRARYHTGRAGPTGRDYVSVTATFYLKVAILISQLVRRDEPTRVNKSVIITKTKERGKLPENPSVKYNQSCSKLVSFTFYSFIVSMACQLISGKWDLCLHIVTNVLLDKSCHKKLRGFYVGVYGCLLDFAVWFYFL